MREICDAVEVVEQVDERGVVVLGQLMNKLPTHCHPVCLDICTANVDEAVVRCRGQHRLRQAADECFENTTDAFDVGKRLFVCEIGEGRVGYEGVLDLGHHRA